MCGFFKRNCLGPQSFFQQLYPCWFLQREVVGTYLPGIGSLGWRAWCGAGCPHSQGIRLKFLSTALGCGTTHSASTPLLPVWMDMVSLIS